jgi:hypothetical protein
MAQRPWIPNHGPVLIPELRRLTQRAHLQLSRAGELFQESGTTPDCVGGWASNGGLETSGRAEGQTSAPIERHQRQTAYALQHDICRQLFTASSACSVILAIASIRCASRNASQRHCEREPSDTAAVTWTTIMPGVKINKNQRFKLQTLV